MLTTTACTFVTLLTGLSLAGPIPHNPNPWILQRDSDGIKLWQREVPDSDIQQVKLEVTIRGSSRRVWDTLRDVEAVPDYNPYVGESRLIEQQGNVRYVYQRFTPPFVDDRDLTYRAVALEDHQTGVYEQLITIANQKGPPPRSGIIRVQVVEAHWLLEPIGSDRTRLLYWIHTDPGGWIPDWFYNWGQRRSVPTMIDSFEKRVLDPTWRP